jgi:DNA-binding transcriptional regulator YdaS (Cro superfamily)
MDLPTFLTQEFRDQAAAAAAFRVSQGTISHWVNRRRFPKPEKAKEIMRKSRGRVSFDGIYGGRPQ